MNKKRIIKEFLLLYIALLFTFLILGLITLKDTSIQSLIEYFWYTFKMSIHPITLGFMAILLIVRFLIERKK